MPVSPRVKLPLLFSALMGLCVLGSEGYVLSGLIRQHAETSQILFASVFALIVFAVWLWGFFRSVRFLSMYAREEAALPQAKTALVSLAQQVEAGKWDRQSMAAGTPLLDRRLTHVWRALQRGAPLLSADMGESEDRHFPGPEREIRTYMDIALNVGIAGTFVSILITLGQPQGLTADTLLAHVGPGMTSGLAAVIANIGLRLCHRAVQDEQDLLAGEVDEAVSESFVASLPKAVTSPEDRVAAATRDLALHATATLEKQSAATQETLVKQAEQFDTLLKAYTLQIATILVQQVQQPIQQVADQTKALSDQTRALTQHSATWAAGVSDLKTAHAAFLKAQTDGQALHEQRLTTTFAQYHRALDLSLQAVAKANADALAQTQELTKRLAALQMEEMKTLTAEMQGRYAALQAEQEAVHQRLTEAAIKAMGSAVDARVATLDERVAATLTAVESRLPNTLRAGVQEGLAETIRMIDSVREQTAEMAHTLSQISGNADRQLQAYERWNDRALSVQGRLEQVVTDGQAAQAAQLAQWQTGAAQALEGVRAAFDGTIHTAQSGFSGLVAALDPLTAELQHLQSTAQELNSALAALPPHTVTLPVPTPSEAAIAPTRAQYDIPPPAPDAPTAATPPAADTSNAAPSALPEWARSTAAASHKPGT
ncbi:MAG: hypothetical protein JWL77_1999 [Chthonomonadaceae bacterium]|nr:hypothetical protein [Chthonomonadaceae bacterium]